jgi:hypothetical protein
MLDPWTHHSVVLVANCATTLYASTARSAGKAAFPV